MPNTVDYIAVINDVQEVILDCAADLEFWQSHLRAGGLAPMERDGRAGIVISATSFKWMGLPTREVTISIAVRGDSAVADFYLVQAFNSSTLLAWMERAFFQTPYVPAEVAVDVRVPASFRLRVGQTTAVHAQMLGVPTPQSITDEIWEGKIYLPCREGVVSQFFCARLGGKTQIFAASGTDTFQLQSLARDDAFDWLAQSNVTPLRWQVRQHALHARSKTFARQKP